MFSRQKQYANIKLISECQHLIAEDLSAPLNMLFDEAEDVLFDLAEKSDNRMKNFYFNAMHEIRLKRGSIKTDFNNSFSELISSHVNGTQQSRFARFFSKRKKRPSEESLAFGSAVGKLNQNCREALLSLDKSMSGILGSVKIDNLFNPESVCIAFQKACDDIESGLEVRLMLLKLFEKHGNSGLKQAYANLKTKLVEKNARSAENYKKEITDNTRLLIANTRTKREINRRVDNAVIPEFMKQFLYTHWYKLLLRIYFKKGINSRAWQQSILVVDDLISLFDSNTLRFSRTRNEEIEYLVNRLKNGMNIILASPEFQEQFIGQLVAYNRLLYKKTDRKSPVPKASINSDSLATGNNTLPFMKELLVDNKWPK